MFGFKLKNFILLLILSMVTDFESPVIEVDIERQQKEQFYAAIEALKIEDDLKKKEKKIKKTRTYTKQNEYDQLILTIETAKSKKETKETFEYNLLRSYDIYVVGQTKKIIEKQEKQDDPIRFLVPYEQLFETIHRIHLQLGHKKRDLMIQACKKNHINLTVDMINIYLNCCQQCLMNKKRNKTTGLTVKPILSHTFNSRAQMDLIDMQTLPDGEFKWILVYQDHFSKFIQLRAIKAKSAIEVTNALFDIFTILGVPLILQSDNGKEFRNQIILALKSMWPELSLINGRARHPQSQGSVRDNVRQSQKKQAEVMRTRSKRYLPEVNIGNFVSLPIPDVDRGLTEASNIICRVIDIDYDFSLYELACEVGVFSDLFSRNAFDLLQNCQVEVSIRTDKTIKSIRQAVNEMSIGGGQGMVKCNCTSQCMTNRCGCRKSNLLCNSRCHGSNLLCTNK